MPTSGRFLFVAGVGIGDTAKPRWPDASLPFRGEVGPNGQWVGWRLLGPNNRELGRSTEAFADLAGARIAADLVRTHAHSFDVEMSSTASRGWLWCLVADATPVVVSARHYARRQECAYNLSVFLSVVVTAGLSDAFPLHVPVARFPLAGHETVDAPAIGLD